MQHEIKAAKDRSVGIGLFVLRPINSRTINKDNIDWFEIRFLHQKSDTKKQWSTTVARGRYCRPKQGSRRCGKTCLSSFVLNRRSDIWRVPRSCPPDAETANTLSWWGLSCGRWLGMLSAMKVRAGFRQNLFQYNTCIMHKHFAHSNQATDGILHG